MRFAVVTGKSQCVTRFHLHPRVDASNSKTRSTIGRSKVLSDFRDFSTDFESQFAVAVNDRNHVKLGTKSTKLNRCGTKTSWKQDWDFTAGKELGRTTVLGNQNWLVKKFRDTVSFKCLYECVKPVSAIVNDTESKCIGTG